MTPVTPAGAARADALRVRFLRLAKLSGARTADDFALAMYEASAAEGLIVVYEGLTGVQDGVPCFTGWGWNTVGHVPKTSTDPCPRCGGDMAVANTACTSLVHRILAT